MIDLIDIEFTQARDLGYVDARFFLYHNDLHDYVGLGLRVMRVCC